MKVPTHLPFLILIVSTIHAVIITVIWPRGHRHMGPGEATSSEMTTGYLDEEALEPDLAINSPSNPLDLMISEEEVVEVPQKAHDHEGEVILEQAAYLFPSQERPISHPSIEKKERLAESEEVLVVSNDRESLYQAPRPVDPEEEEAEEIVAVEPKPQPPAKPAVVEIDVAKEPAPKLDFSNPVVVEKIVTTPEDIAAELNNLEIKDTEVSDSAVAAAMKMWEKRDKEATSTVQKTTPIARPIKTIEVQKEPSVISPPPIP